MLERAARARHFNMMPPRTASRSSPRAATRPLRISFRRVPVVAIVIPIRAPFMDVVAGVVEPICIRRIQPNGFPAPASTVSRNRRPSPGVYLPTGTANLPPRRALLVPIRLRWATDKICLSCRLATRSSSPPRATTPPPPACGARLKFASFQFGGGAAFVAARKSRVVSVRHLVRAELKCIHPHPMHGLLVIAPPWRSPSQTTPPECAPSPAR